MFYSKSHKKCDVKVQPSTNDILVLNIYHNMHDFASNNLCNKQIKNT